MKHKLLVNVSDDMYNKLVFISNYCGMSITDFLTQLLVTDDFKKTVNVIFDNMAKMAVNETIDIMSQEMKKDCKTMK